MKFEPIESFDQYRELTGSARRKFLSGFSNCYLMSNEARSLIDSGALLYASSPRGLLLGRAYPQHMQLMFYLADTADKNDVPESDLPLVIELPFATQSLEDALPSQIRGAQDLLRNCGFVPARISHRRTYEADTLKDVTRGDDGAAQRVIELGDKYSSAMLDQLNNTFDYRFDYIPSKEEWQEALDQGHVLAHIDEAGKPDGVLFFDIQKNQSELRLITVLPQARRQGVASALIAAWRKRCVDTVSRLFLWVSDDNAGAQRLYGNEGFHFDGHRAIELVELTTDNFEKES